MSDILTIKEWLSYLETIITTEHNRTSLMNSLKTDRKVTVSSFISLLLVGIVAFISSSQLPVNEKMICALISLLSFCVIVFLNNRYWENKFSADLEKNYLYIGDLEGIIAKIFDEKLEK